MATTNSSKPEGRHSSSTHLDGTPTDLPIVIAGAGCVGLFLAMLLVQSPIPNRIIVVEPFQPSKHVTRAMAHQPMIFPLFTRAGLMTELSRVGSFGNGQCYRTSARNGSKFIVGKKFKEGEKGQLLLPQGKFQDVLMRQVEKDNKSEIRIGWQLVGFQDTGRRVDVKIQHEDGRKETLEAEYLIGADGAKSTVRKLLNMPFDGMTLPAQLVATDIMYDFHAHGFYDSNHIVDAENYGHIGRINDEGMWRVSYGMPVDTAEDEIRASVEEKIKKLLPDGGKSGFEIKHVAPYKPQQRCVDALWTGRVGLCGDAAHLTNPYAGLGLASGIADASSLADVLIHILSQQAKNPAELLSSWSDDRRQKFLSAVDKPSRMAYARVRTKADTEEEVQDLLEKDKVMGALNKGIPMTRPSVDTRGEDLMGW